MYVQAHPDQRPQLAVRGLHARRRTHGRRHHRGHSQEPYRLRILNLSFLMSDFFFSKEYPIEFNIGNVGNK